MKTIKTFVIAFILLLVLLPFILTEREVKEVQAIDLGNRFWHCDTLYITTAVNDCTWTNEWYEATIYSDTVDVDVRIGAPDTASWNSRIYARLFQGMTITLGPSPKVKKISVKTVTGTGRLYIVGLKNVRQY